MSMTLGWDTILPCIGRCYYAGMKDVRFLHRRWESENKPWDILKRDREERDVPRGKSYNKIETPITIGTYRSLKRLMNLKSKNTVVLANKEVTVSSHTPSWRRLILLFPSRVCV